MFLIWANLSNPYINLKKRTKCANSPLTSKNYRMTLKYPRISMLTHRLKTAPRFITRVCPNTCSSNIFFYQNYTKYRVTISCRRVTAKIYYQTQPSLRNLVNSLELLRNAIWGSPRKRIANRRWWQCLHSNEARGLSIWSFYLCSDFWRGVSRLICLLWLKKYNWSAPKSANSHRWFTATVTKEEALRN